MQNPNYGRPALIFTLLLLGLTCVFVLILIFFLTNSYSLGINNLIFVLLAVIGYLTVYSFLFTAYIFWGSYRFRDKLLGLYKCKGDENVLYIGKSFGLLMIGAAKELTTGKCTGIDFYEVEDKGKVSAQIMNNALLEGVPDKIDLQDEHMPDTYLPEGSFDVIFSNMGLSKFNKAPDLLKAASEINRLLKINGKAIIADLKKPDKLRNAFRSQGLHVQIAGNYFSTAFIPLKVMVVTKGDKPDKLAKLKEQK